MKPEGQWTQWAAVGLISLLWAGCCKKMPWQKDEPDAGPSASASASSSASVAALGEQSTNIGPTVTIPPGTLLAGTPCSFIPRITNEELKAVPIALSAFTMDVYPYPNDPSKVPLTGVTREQAQTLCAARGRRLCTELEWERACKGPNNTMYEYGNQFNPKVCTGSSAILRQASSYDTCQSGFGVKAMHGAVWEWTSSEWGRGGPGGIAAVRGGGGANPSLQGRCSNGQSRSPAETSAELGFRCCGEPSNSAKVDLNLDKLQALIQDQAVDSALASKLLATLPKEMREIQGVTVGIDQLWRWHPRSNEEMLIARYVGKRTGKPSFYHPLVFHVCGNTPVLLAHLPGPIEWMQAPATGTDPQKVTLSIKTGTDTGEVQFNYVYGAVSEKHPAWVKKANVLEDSGPQPPKIRLRLPGTK